MKESVQLLENQGINVYINTEEITLELLNNKIGEKGLLIICLLDKEVSAEKEGEAINQWVKAGGSLFTGTQPDYAGFGYSKNANTNNFT